MVNRLFIFCVFAAFGFSATAQTFLLPTANRAIFEPGNEEKYFVGTVGKPWMSGTFGCVRSSGNQLHEGLDIRCLQRDKSGESIDPVLAVADGTVTYINKKAGLSNYGNYLVLRHRIERMEIFSLYAHLREIRADLKTGALVKAGETVATMGRTTNTREGISKDRAHLHFELNFFINDRFVDYYKKTFPGQRNDHAEWNGQNLLGFDPRAVLLADHQAGGKLSLINWIQNQNELCRVVVRDKDFSWVKRHRQLVRANPVAQKEGIAGYELVLSYTGMPFQIIPRAASELKSKSKYQLLSVNETEYKTNPCRQLVTKRSGRWELASNGIRHLDLLTF